VALDGRCMGDMEFTAKLRRTRRLFLVTDYALAPFAHSR
jgi:hypothetical protein